MIKWLKRKIDIYNNNLDYGNYEDHISLGEWIIYAILGLIIPIGLGLMITLKENNWFYFCVGIVFTIVIEGLLCSHINLFPVINTDAFSCEDIKFIWGIISADDLTTAKNASLFTMNDLEILYNENTKTFILNIETIYSFPQGKIGEVNYFNKLLKEFTKYMEENDFNTKVPYKFQEVNNPEIILEAKTIPELYTQFRIFVEGYNAVYGGKEDEAVCNI